MFGYYDYIEDYVKYAIGQACMLWNLICLTMVQGTSTMWVFASMYFSHVQYIGKIKKFLEKYKDVYRDGTKWQKQEGMSCGELFAVCGFHMQGFPHAPYLYIWQQHVANQ